MTKRKNRSLEIIADDIHGLARTNIFDIGELLIEAKDQCEHGQWLEWLDNEFDYAASTAERYMNAARLRVKFPTVRNLKLAASTVYKLADCADADYLPSVIRELAKHAADKRLTHPDADRVIKIGIGRHRHGDHPDATLAKLVKLDEFNEESWHPQAVADLLERDPETDEIAESIVDKIEQAHEDTERAQWEAEQARREAKWEAERNAEDEAESTLDGPMPELPPATTPPEPQKFDSATQWAGADEFSDAVETLSELSTKPAKRFVGKVDTDTLRGVIDFLMAVMGAEAEEKRAKPKETITLETATDTSTSLNWSTTVDGKVHLTTTPAAEFKITGTGSNFTLSRKRPGECWSPDHMMGCFDTLDAAKAAVEQHGKPKETSTTPTTTVKTVPLTSTELDRRKAGVA